MTERFNVGGALLLKLFGRRDEEDAKYAEKAGLVRDLGIRISLITRVFMATMMLIPALATALVYGIGGTLAISGALTIGTLTALATLLLRLLGPLQGLSNVRVDVMTALVSFDRVFEVLDLPSTVVEKPDAVAVPPTASRVEFDRVDFTYPRADEVSLASLETVARVESRDHGQVLHDVTFTAEPGPDGRPGRALRRRQDHDHPPGRPALRRHRRRGPGRRPRRARRDAAVARGRRRLRHPGRAHVPRHHPREPPLRRARGHRRGDLGGARVGPDRDAGARRCPTGSTPSSATAATGSPVASGSGWRSPGCCSRLPGSSYSTRRPPTSTPSRSTPCSAPSTRRSRAAPRWSSPTGSPRCATPTRSSSSTTAGSCSAAPTTSCSPRAGSTPTSTAPSSSRTPSSLTRSS